MQIDKSKLESYVQRIERLNEERKGLTADINDIKNEAVSAGFDRNALTEVIRLRAMDSGKRQDLDNALTTYKLALGLE